MHILLQKKYGNNLVDSVLLDFWVLGWLSFYEINHHWSFLEFFRNKQGLLCLLLLYHLPVIWSSHLGKRSNSCGVYKLTLSTWPKASIPINQKEYERLIYFRPMFSFYTPWRHQKNKKHVFTGYRGKISRKWVRVIGSYLLEIFLLL